MNLETHFFLMFLRKGASINNIFKERMNRKFGAKSEIGMQSQYGVVRPETFLAISSTQEM